MSIGKGKIKVTRINVGSDQEYIKIIQRQPGSPDKVMAEHLYLCQFEGEFDTEKLSKYLGDLLYRSINGDGFIPCVVPSKLEITLED